MTARSRHLVILLSTVALIALPAAARAATTVTIQADPSGRVTSQPAGIDCPGTCTATFAQGATLTAQPAQGYAFGDPNDNGAPGNKDGWITFLGDNVHDPARPASALHAARGRGTPRSPRTSARRRNSTSSRPAVGRSPRRSPPPARASGPPRPATEIRRAVCRASTPTCPGVR